MTHGKPRSCREPRCDEAVHLGGLCQKHHEEDSRRSRRRDAAVGALHTLIIDGRLPEGPGLREELLNLRPWWDRACDAVQTNRGSQLMPLDEAEFALEWCISLAQEIVDAELAVRSGRTIENSLGYTREWVWERFKNLEAGRRSNGLARDAGR
jgi:hypothetical protein